MKKNHFKLRIKNTGGHIRVTVFSGNEGETLANCGELTFRIGEYQLFGALLSLGYEHPGTIKQHCHLTFDGEAEALK